MIILTAANYKFTKIINLFVKHTNRLNYETLIYDLGKLGYGKNYNIQNEFFQEKGYYCQIKNTWKTKAIHKPKIILDALKTYKQKIAYLDADAILYKRIDEIEEQEFDVGFTIRRESELIDEPLEHHKFVMGNINAGVIFFNYNTTSLDFLFEWIKLCETEKNDQLALNLLLNINLPRNGITNYKNINILTVPTDIYNFYYFEENYTNNTKIIHYKNNLWTNGFQYRNILL